MKKIFRCKKQHFIFKLKKYKKTLAETSFKINHFFPKNLLAVTGTNGKSSIADFIFKF